MKKASIALCSILTFSCFSDTLITLDGKKYEDYQIMSPYHHGLEIMHSEGISTVPYEKLPQDLQAKYAEKAKQLKAAEKERIKRYAEYKKYQKEQKEKEKENKKAIEKLKKLTFDFWADDEISDNTERMKCLEIWSKTTIFARPFEYTDYIVITDIDTAHLTSNSYIPGNIKFRKKTKKNDKIRLYYTGTINSKYGKLHQFTTNKQKAIDFIKKNPNTKIPQMTEKKFPTRTIGFF